VSGVLSVAQNLSVKVLSNHARQDADSTSAPRNAFKWDISVPDTVGAKVHDGMVTLTGSAHWNFQREAAERAVRVMRRLFLPVGDN
jgi:osmotically-inducible protein OsmY